ncbi:hypothetical protein [Pedobacter sp. MR2016-24]|uniref:hypothetical protein n=1 Tax=Pedobacter sp. MR2016-24 TaxID=2994466 RepID=UPI0022453445|nr:hypothetical protein [Pedobacter sp. MR2016-24]MCX2484617.1 hypothetical protein [Pedobacter sp. MR2016-24]
METNVQQTVNHQLIEIPLEFKVACFISKIEVAEALQIFINHVTLYDTLSTGYVEGYSEASGIHETYVQSKGLTPAPGTGLTGCNELFVRSLSDVIKLTKDQKSTAAVKRKKSRSIIKAVFKAMKRVHTPSLTIYLDEEATIHLSEDFCLMCEIQNIYPKECLEYFMNSISLADAHARRDLQGAADLPISLFLKIGSGFGRDPHTRVNLNDTEIDFFAEMNEKLLELRTVRNVEQRTNILREFYLSHYLNMNH